MDPQATFVFLYDALAEHDLDRIGELAQRLLRWLEDGGSPPIAAGPQSLDAPWHREVAMAICHASLSYAYRHADLGDQS